MPLQHCSKDKYGFLGSQGDEEQGAGSGSLAEARGEGMVCDYCLGMPVETIGEKAFYHCEEVKIVIYNGTKQELSQISKPKLAFMDIRTNSIMCVDGYYHIKERYTKTLTKNL